MTLRSTALAIALGATLSLACGTRRASAPPSRPPSLPDIAWRHVPLGLCEDYPEETRTLDEAGHDFGVLEAAGVHVLRVSIGWDGVEPEKDRYDFAFWDAFVDLADQRGIRLLPYVAYTPAWNSDGAPEMSWKAPPRDVAEFGEIMQLLAARYRGRIRSWEIWNEPDNRDYWLGSAENYAALLAVGSKAVRRADPGAQVVSGGLAGGVEFLRELFDDYAVSPTVDVVNVHAYYETWNPSAAETLPAYLDDVSAIVARHGGRQPIWLAEVGYSDWRKPGAPQLAPYSHTAEYQAVMLVRTLALALAHPSVSLVAWYELKDPSALAPMIGDDHNRHLGVTFADRSPKPAFAALAWTQATFGAGFAVVDPAVRVSCPAASTVEHRAFVTERGDLVIVTWLPTGATPATEARRARVRVAAPFLRRGEVRVYDEQGRGVRAEVQEPPGEGVDFSFELGDGEVRVVEQSVATAR